MLGAIIGDIVGSIYEPKDRRIKNLPNLHLGCQSGIRSCHN